MRFGRVTRDQALQIQRVEMRYERWRRGHVVGNVHATFHMRWFHRYELEHLMARAGFVDVEIYGDFDRSPVEKDSPALIVVGRRH